MNDTELTEVVRVMRENGLTDRPDQYDGDIHSWRCSHPDIYGPCSCFQELAADVAALLAARVAAAHAASERRLELLRTVVAYDNANQSDLPLSLLDAIRAEVGGPL